MKHNMKGLLLTLPGLILAVGVRTVFSPCVHTDGSVSTCAACGNGVFIAGIALAAAAALRAFLPRRMKPAADGVLALISLGSFLLPMLQKTCMLQSMRCNTVMKPAVWLVSAVSLVLFILTLVHDLRTGKEKKHA